MKLEARTDLDRLKHYIDLPSPSARWLVLPRGIPSRAPGPTDTVLWAFAPLTESAWAALGAPLAPDSIEVPAEVAGALWPSASAPSATQSLTGPVYDLSKRVLNPYQAGQAIRVRDGILVVLYSR